MYNGTGVWIFKSVKKRLIAKLSREYRSRRETDCKTQARTTIIDCFFHIDVFFLLTLTSFVYNTFSKLMFIVNGFFLFKVLILGNSICSKLVKLRMKSYKSNSATQQ